MNRRCAAASVTPAMASAVCAAPGSATAADTGPALSLTVSQAMVRQDEAMGHSVLDIRLDPQPRAAFAQFTARHVGQRIVLRSGGKVLLAPVIREPIFGGRLIISPGVGPQDLSPLELNAIAARLGSGAAIEVALQPGP